MKESVTLKSGAVSVIEYFVLYIRAGLINWYILIVFFMCMLIISCSFTDKVSPSVGASFLRRIGGAFWMFGHVKDPVYTFNHKNSLIMVLCLYTIRGLWGGDACEN